MILSILGSIALMTAITIGAHIEYKIIKSAKKYRSVEISLQNGKKACITLKGDPIDCGDKTLLTGICMDCVDDKTKMEQTISQFYGKNLVRFTIVPEKRTAE